MGPLTRHLLAATSIVLGQPPAAPAEGRPPRRSVNYSRRPRYADIVKTWMLRYVHRRAAERHVRPELGLEGSGEEPFDQ